MALSSSRPDHIEGTKLIYSYCWDKLSNEEIAEFIELACLFGESAEQEAVIIEIDGHAYLIPEKDYES